MSIPNPVPKGESAAASEVRLPDGQAAPYHLDPFARHCLLNGVDELGYLLSRLPDIEAWDRKGAVPL